MSKPSKWFLLKNPTIFQGWGRSDNYFEGWYFKIVDPRNNLAFALIPGISKSNDAHAFIQFIDGVNCQTAYYRYDIDAFQAKQDRFDINIGDNHFTERSIKLDEAELTIELTQSSWNVLKTSLLQPGIMGWYAYMPFMQCYHGLVSMDHKVSGHVRLNEKDYKLDRVKAYIEKDWGVSFPKSWIWNQCNTFENEEDLSVFASVAHIPWLGSYFIGFIAAIYYKGKIEVFATYNNSKRETQVRDNNVTLIFKKGKKTLKVESRKEAGADLKSPFQGEMISKVNESLMATMKVKYEVNGKVVVEDSGSFAGMELAGPVDILLE